MSITKKSEDKKRKKQKDRKKDSKRKNGEGKGKGGGEKGENDVVEEKHMVKFMKKLKELSDDDFVVETVSVHLQTHPDSRIALTMENTVSGAPKCATESIDLGDQILAINGKKVANREDTRNVFREIKKSVLKESQGKCLDFDVQITRRRLRRLKLAQVPKMLVSEDLPKGFEFYEALLVLYPNSSIGFNVKPAINLRCMVSSVDGGWKSVAKKVFQVGDIILYIAGSNEGQEVNSVAAAKAALVNYAKGSFIRVWFARAKDPVCVRQVRAALVQDKPSGTGKDKDPRMAADCLDIVKEELAAMDYRLTKKMTYPEVVKDYNEHEKRRINYRNKSKFVRIGVEAHVNPHHLSMVPTREKKKPSVSPAAAPTPPTPPPPPAAPLPNPLDLIKNSLPRKKKVPGKNKSKDSKEDKGGSAETGTDQSNDPDSSRKNSKKNSHSNEDEKNVKSNYIFEDMNKNPVAAYKVDIFDGAGNDGGAKKDPTDPGADSSSTKDKPKN